MAVIGNSYVNIIDELKGKALGPVVNMLRLYNTIYEDAITVPANKGMSHMTTIMTGLPSVTWGKLYQGIPQSKTARQQVEDTTGFVEGLSTIDKRLLDLSDDPGMTRLIEAQGFIESFAQEIATGIFYFDTLTTPEKFKGLAARYNVLAGGGAGNNVIDGGGVGSDNTSIWLVTWGDNFTHLIHPKGTTVGLMREDKGEQRLLDALGNPYYGMEELFRQHIGLTVRDWRYNARIANIDVSELVAGNVDIYVLMRKLYWRVKRITRTDPNPGLGVAGARQVIYANATVLEALDAQSNTNVNNPALRIDRTQLEGAEVMTYRGIPIRQADALLNTETRVV
jgi:hypothetical protein